MKFSFKIQQYQTEAVDAVVRVFEGNKYWAESKYIRDLGTLPENTQNDSLLPGAQSCSQEEDDLLSTTGFKNGPLTLSDEALLANIQKIQAGNNISLSQKLDDSLGRCSLDIEMETGTGKTYVYIKTMFELNKRYGWCKFIVVVPSIAIREGVKKSFEMTQDHFMVCYGKKARCFAYNSSNLNQLDAFSSDEGINVMIINTQAFASSMNE
ncbi:MAG: DEAD/DEAH box helicase family protein, partial [Desulfovibrionaceae bacterium]|nr:DEAD/DEAH box helicase family protein [Desulfovibrionaceae bacterium]